MTTTARPARPTRAARYEIVHTLTKGGADSYHVRLVARNNEILSTSETYPDHATAADNILAQSAAHAHIASGDPISIVDVDEIDETEPAS